jgi:hypothetical protein
MNSRLKKFVWLLALSSNCLLSACGEDMTPRSASSALERTGSLERESVSELLHLVGKQDVEGVKALLGKGISPDSAGDPRSPLVVAITSLHSSTIDCSKEMVTLLLQHGADPNRRDPRIGALPLHTALEVGSVDCATLLKDAGARMENHDDRGFSALSAAALGASRLSRPELVDLAVHWGISPNTRDVDGSTALHHAVRVPNSEIVKKLLDVGVDPCLRNGIGQTPLEMARNLNRPVNLIRVLEGGAPCGQ